ncbi:hypothetical protein AB3S75_003194 [Citrus x aurantiifolia]
MSKHFAICFKEIVSKLSFVDQRWRSSDSFVANHVGSERFEELPKVGIAQLKRAAVSVPYTAGSSPPSDRILL